MKKGGAAASKHVRQMHSPFSIYHFLFSIPRRGKMARTEFHAQLAALRAHVLDLGGLAMSAIERVIEALQESDHAVAETIVVEDAATDTLHAAIQKDAILTLARQQ